MFKTTAHIADFSFLQFRKKMNLTNKKLTISQEAHSDRLWIKSKNALTSHDPLIIRPMRAGDLLTATADKAVKPTLPAKYM